MKTRKQVIDLKYTEMKEYISKNLGCEFFPSLNDVDTSDILILIQMYFSPHYESGTYDKIIKDGLKLQKIQVDEELFDKHYPKIKEYIDFLIEFMKSQH